MLITSPTNKNSNSAQTVKATGYITSTASILQTIINPLNAELNPICYLLALLGAHHFLHVSRIRVKSLTPRLLMSYVYIYIYGAPILDVSRSHTTQHSRQDSSGRLISSSQRPLPDNTRHSRQTNIHATGGIRTQDLSRRAALPLACWDLGFESHRGHGYLSVVSVVCCQAEVSATSWSLIQRSPTDCAASSCVI